MKTGEKSKNNTEIRKMKCWEVFRCDQKDCPAYKSKEPQMLAFYRDPLS